MGAPLPVAAGGAVAPPRPALISTYCQYYQSTLDPHQMPSQVFETYCPDATLWTANLLWYATNPIYPVIFLSLVEQTDWPWLYITPTAVTQQVAGPAGDLGNFTFDADFTDSGAPLGIVGLPNDLQHMAPATTVPTLDQMAALWAAAPANANYISSADVAAVTTEPVTTRHSVPVPHVYAEQILEAQALGALTNRWLWATVGQPIVDAGALAVVDYAHFLNFLRNSSVMHPGHNAGNPDRTPAVVTALPVVVLTAMVRDAMQARAGHHLPGLRSTAGLGTQISSIHTGSHQCCSAGRATAQDEDAEG